MKYIIALLITLVSIPSHADPLSIISGTLSIASSLHTLLKDKKEEKPQAKVEESAPLGYHFENIVDVDCQCVKKIMVANRSSDYPF